MTDSIVFCGASAAAPRWPTRSTGRLASYGSGWTIAFQSNRLVPSV